MRLLVQSIRDYAIFMLDPRGVIVSWNIGAERIKGYTGEEIVGTHFSVFYPPEAVAAGKPAKGLRAAAADGRWEEEGWRVRKDGTRFWASVVITALYDESGGLRGFGKVTRDLTERRSMARALDERALLLSRLVQAQELERRRIASDVHDDTIQSMLTVGMRLRMWGQELPPEHGGTVRALDAAVDEAVRRLRELAFDLHPPGDGLVASLDDYLSELMPGGGLAYELSHRLDAEPPYEAVVTIYRICQEALTNVRRHAGASRVSVELVSLDRGVHVRVKDDGVGLAGKDGEAMHYGLVEMRERAETAGGWWGIEGPPGAGTTVEFWVPAVPHA
ncbi:PAS domain-containing sensor histidine kinase [Nonomuraea gerenzanensis]|uniref:histidine kinase n=1 Tax=Nonomuraea gerenzanensis TaxID=93944 RepID=A0A1M4E9A3_9ACTN|nr:PAS domain S-box protein [Nonomuraea gerenzanensis]UBU17579.1 PAS domain S-box protein [Nonomuraea gerenzanensis]SBO95342.1 Sensory box histidine kinase [Nonomuraea gerenzanensis]